MTGSFSANLLASAVTADLYLDEFPFVEMIRPKSLIEQFEAGGLPCRGPTCGITCHEFG